MARSTKAAQPPSPQARLDEFRSAIDAPYRWRDWAADPNGSTGEMLLTFVNTKLLPYLRRLTGTGAHDPRDVLSSVFKETNNRMLSGYLLRDVVNKVNDINFASADDIHTMAHLYESSCQAVSAVCIPAGKFDSWKSSKPRSAAIGDGSTETAARRAAHAGDRSG